MCIKATFPVACLAPSHHGVYTVYTGSGGRKAKGTTGMFPLLPLRCVCLVHRALHSVKQGSVSGAVLEMHLPSSLPASVWAKVGRWTEALIALKELKDELGRKGWNGPRESSMVVLGVGSEASDRISLDL